jgi:hypothetical protein
VSVAITVVAVFGPLFFAVSTYVRFVPAYTGCGVAILVNCMSATGVITVDVVEVLLAVFGSPTSAEATVAVLLRGVVVFVAMI